MTRPTAIANTLLLTSLLLATCLPCTAADEADRTWGYRGEGGKTAPADWPGLCQTGPNQSPVNLTRNAASGEPADAIEFRYQPAVSEVLNNGHAIEVKNVAGTIEVAKVQYQLCGLHFHTPSEHTRDNVGAPAEVHFVHQETCGDTKGWLVVGALIEPASHEHPGNRTLAAYLAKLRSLPASTPELNPQSILPASGYIQYPGSLTTPGCGGPVNWFVAREPIYLDRTTLDRLRALYPNNARPGQALGDRKLRGF